MTSPALIPTLILTGPLPVAAVSEPNQSDRTGSVRAVPESRFKYLYERLGDHNFQLLANALLTARFTDFVPLPLRQADGGRDGITRGSDRSLIYQVKWSVNGKEKDPVDWLDKAITGEADNIKRLVRDGARRYVLVTNIPSTGKPTRELSTS